jgi:hypothetical protein
MYFYFHIPEKVEKLKDQSAGECSNYARRYNNNI